MSSERALELWSYDLMTWCFVSLAAVRHIHSFSFAIVLVIALLLFALLIVTSTLERQFLLPPIHTTTLYHSTMAMLEPPLTILELLRESLPDDVAVDSPDSGSDEVLAYTAFLAAGLADSHEFDASVWSEALEPYLSSLLENSHLNLVVNHFRQATEKATMGEDDADSYGDEDDDDAEEVCDLRFNLAYGGKILLFQTKLRLLRGHRYGLVRARSSYYAVQLYYNDTINELVTNHLLFTLHYYIGWSKWCWKDDAHECNYQWQVGRMAYRHSYFLCR